MRYITTEYPARPAGPGSLPFVNCRRMSILVWVMLQMGLAVMAQHGRLEVRMLEYVHDTDPKWSSDHPPEMSRFITSDSLSGHLLRAIGLALQRRWAYEPFALHIDVHSTKGNGQDHDFRTTVNNPDPDKAYLFLQIFDRGQSVLMRSGSDHFVSSWVLRSRLVSGRDRSQIQDRKLEVGIFTRVPPEGQVPMPGVSIFPPEFRRLSDSLASWAFGSGQETAHEMVLRPACLFLPPIPSPIAAAIFELHSGPSSIFLDDGMRFILHPHPTILDPLVQDGNEVGNAFSTLLTAATRIGTSNTRTLYYSRDYPYTDGREVYHCRVRFAELERNAQVRKKRDGQSGAYNLTRTGYGVEGRLLLPEFRQSITTRDSVRVSYGVRFIPDPEDALPNPRVWDGMDSSNIQEIPSSWLDRRGFWAVELSGKIDGKAFLLRSCCLGNRWQFAIAGKLAIVSDTRGGRTLMQPMHDVSEMEMKTFLMLTHIPFMEYR
jgi:hypothetical protein